MSSYLFVTGATGFVGRRLVRLLARREKAPIRCLIRGKLPNELAELPGLQAVRGDLLDQESYRDELSGCRAVIHLAAATGKMRPSEYFRTNVDGTRALLDICQQAGLKRFIYVSTVAAKFNDLAGYPYAQSKKQAESIVGNSGLSHTIVRPTIVAGDGAPVIEGLKQLACAPLMIVPGSGRAKIQPILVDDLAQCIAELADEETSVNSIIDVGGPERMTIEELMLCIRRSAGKSGSVLHLPTQLFSWPLAILEKVALPLLPVTRGQLRTFTSDGIADDSTFLTAHRPGMTSVMEWLAPGEQPHARSTVTNTPMDSECQVFTRYLTGQDASPQVRQKYKALNEIRKEFWPGGDAEPFDTRLISIAVRGPRWARIADSYARWFCPGSRLRKKMVLLLALLECTSPSFRYLDETDSENRLVSYSVLMLTALVALASLAAGIVVIGPQHWFSGIRTSSDPARLTE